MIYTFTDIYAHSCLCCHQWIVLLLTIRKSPCIRIVCVFVYLLWLFFVHFFVPLVLSRNFRFVYSVVASVSLKFTIRTSIFGFYSKNFVWNYFLFAVLFNHVVKFRSEQLSISCVFFYSNNSHVNVSHL